jgi:hypothetical protein
MFTALVRQAQEFPDNRYAPAIMILAGLLLRVLLHTLWPVLPISDAFDYDLLARNLLATGIYGPDGHFSAYRPCGFPFILAAFYGMLGTHWGGIILQSLLVSLNGWLIYKLAILWDVQPGRAFWVLIAWLFMPATLAQSLMLYSEPLCTACMLGGIILAWPLEKQPNAGLKMLISGILWGIGILSRPVLLPIALLFSPLLLALVRKRKIYFSVSKTVLILWCAGLIMSIMPWMIRNYFRLGYFATAGNGGINFWIGNNPKANGSYLLPEEPLELAAITDEKSRDSIAYALGKEYIRTMPLRAIGMIPVKLAFLWSSDAYIALAFSPDVIHHPGYRARIAAIPFWKLALFCIPTMLVLLAGWFYLPAILHTDHGIMIAALIIFWCLVHAIWFGSGRYHEPLLPFFLIIPACALARQQSKAIYRLFPALAQIIIWCAEFTMIFSA